MTEMADDEAVSFRREVDTGETPCRGVTLGESIVDFDCFCGEILRSFLSLIFNVVMR
jgi:hypothetical protein